MGGGAQVISSRSFFCMSDLPPQKIRDLLAYTEATYRTVTSFLRAAAWAVITASMCFLLFADHDDYFAYTSYFQRAGTHILSGGMFIRRGYAHVAMPYTNVFLAQHVLVHELTHNLLCHLPIPLWLNEGLAVTSEKMVLNENFILDRELAERHRRHWNEINLQAFWAGKTYNMPGDDSELSYSLGEILVRLIAEKGEKFIPFVQSADWRDGGQTAAHSRFWGGSGRDGGRFSGAGDWRPQRKAIADHLKAPAKSD